MTEERVQADASTVLMNCAVDLLEFCLTPGILPQFHDWLIRKPGVSPGITPRSLGEDMQIILAAARGEEHQYVDYRKTVEVQVDVLKVAITVTCACGAVIWQGPGEIAEKYPFWCDNCQEYASTGSYPWTLKAEIIPA